jgi:hypothetical protein
MISLMRVFSVFAISVSLALSACGSAPPPSTAAAVPSTGHPSAAATSRLVPGSVKHIGVTGELPNKWVVEAVLGDGTLLIRLSPDPAKSRQGVALGKMDARSGRVTVLIEVPVGKQMGYFSVAGNTLSWVEVNVSDPAALDWRLHVTDADTGVDHVVQSDPGLRITASGPWTYSYRPVFWQEAQSLLHTIFVPGEGNPSTQLRRITGERTEILATIPDASRNVFARLTADERSVAWVENQLPATSFLATSALVVRDNATGAMRRMVIPSGFILRFAGDDIVIGAKEGVFVVDRMLATPLRHLVDAANVEFMAIVGDDVVFSSTNDHRVQAVRRSGGPAVELDTDVVRGPYQANSGNGLAAWHRVVDGEASIGILPAQ